MRFRLINIVLNMIILCMIMLIFIPAMIAIIICGDRNISYCLDNLKIDRNIGVLWQESFMGVLKLPVYHKINYDIKYSNCILM